MANDAATLRTRLAEQLNDPLFGYWSSTVMDNLIKDAINALYPRFFRWLATESQTIAAVADASWYTLPTDMVEVFRIDWLDSSGKMVDAMPGGSWQVHGTRLQINPGYSLAGYTFRLVGAAKYDLTTNYIPDELVELVLSRARAEAYRRAMGDRMNFKQWAARSQVQNVSVNEMLGMIRDAEQKAEQLTVTTNRNMRLPVPGRVG